MIAEPTSRQRRLFLAEALEMERSDALAAGELAFMCRLFCQVGMPQSSRPCAEPWKRDNGLVKLLMLPHPDLGLPYGTIPRRIMAYITTEAVRINSPYIELGRSLSAFLQALEMGALTGGVNGTATRIRKQVQRLFTTTVSASHDFRDIDTGKRTWGSSGFRLSEDVRLCWHPKDPDQGGLWGSSVLLTDGFFAMLRERPVPIDRRAVAALRSPLAMDLYCWLTFRLSYLSQEREISWELLERQFGANYSSLSEFRRNCIARLPEVLAVYPGARVSLGKSGLILKPSPSHVARALPKRSMP